MAWPATVTAGQPATAAQYNALQAALALWGGNVDAGGYRLTNAAAVVLTGGVGIESVAGGSTLAATNGAGTLKGFQCQNLAVNDSVNVTNNVVAQTISSRAGVSGHSVTVSDASTTATSLALANSSSGGHNFALGSTGSAYSPGHLLFADNTRPENVMALDASGGAGASVRLKLGSDGFIGFAAGTNALGAADVGILRSGAAQLAVVDGTGAAATLTANTFAAQVSVTTPAATVTTQLTLNPAGLLVWNAGSGQTQFAFMQSSGHFMGYTEGNSALAAASRASCLFLRCRGLVFGMAAGPSSDTSLVDGEGYFFLQVNGANGKWQIWAKVRVSGAVHLWNLGDWAS